MTEEVLKSREGNAAGGWRKRHLSGSGRMFGDSLA